MKAAVLADFDWVMHGNIMEQDTVDLLAERQTPLVPTLLLLENWAEYGDADRRPPRSSRAASGCSSGRTRACIWPTTRVSASSSALTPASQ